MNARMRSRYDALQDRLDTEPHRELASILEAGFTRVGGCVFLRSLLPQARALRREQFEDEIAYECAVNHIHIDSYVADDVLLNGLVYAKAVGALWKKQGDIDRLRVTLSSNDDGDCVVRCYLVRGSATWGVDNLEAYEEAVWEDDF
jgi:hypothetical protein